MFLRLLLIPIFLCFFSNLTAQEEPSLTPETGFAEESSEDANISLLIRAQEQSAQKLKALLHYLSLYRAQEEKCIDDPDNLDELYKLSEYALQVKQTIKECYVEPYFRPNFLDDLDKISITAEKRTPPPLSKT